MSIHDSVRNLGDITVSRLPAKTFTVGLPDSDHTWAKLKFMQAARKEKIAAAQDDVMWEVCGCPDDLERPE